MRPEGSVLRVDKSISGRAWARRPAWDASVAERTQHATGCSAVVANILAGCGVKPEEAADWLDPKLRALMPDPSVLVDADKAAQLLKSIAIDKRHTAIIGDYDVDGAASSALLARWLRALGVDPMIHIPDRILEGYGPNRAAIDTLAEQGADVLITVDCGATSVDALGYAKERGLTVLVFDHHQMTGPGPAVDCLVNPNRSDDTSGLGHLCAAGVTFMVLVAANRALREHEGAKPPDLLKLLDLVALATVADVVPLVGLNRAFVRQGLTIARARKNAGLAALIDVAALKGPLRDRHFGFVLGPRINAGGRIGDAAMGARLLGTENVDDAHRLAAELDTLNAQRQVIEAEAVASAIAQAERLAEDEPIIIVREPDWHPGVVGLIAARVKERFGRPAFALTQDREGHWVGSARSILGVDIGSAVHALVREGLALKGGGHAMAAGLTIASNRLGAAAEYLRQHLLDAVTATTARPEAYIDAVITAHAASLSLVQDLEQVAPYGQGFPEPQFAFPSHRVRSATSVGAGHVKIRLSDGESAALDGIAFRAADTELGKALLAAKAGAPIHVRGSLERNSWMGRETVQLHITDAAHPL